MRRKGLVAMLKCHVIWKHLPRVCHRIHWGILCIDSSESCPAHSAASSPPENTQTKPHTDIKTLMHLWLHLLYTCELRVGQRHKKQPVSSYKLENDLLEEMHVIAAHTETERSGCAEEFKAGYWWEKSSELIVLNFWKWKGGFFFSLTVYLQHWAVQVQTCCV